MKIKKYEMFLLGVFAGMVLQIILMLIIFYFVIEFKHT